MWRCSITQRRQTTSASRLFIFFFYISFQILYFFLFSSTCWYREERARSVCWWLFISRDEFFDKMAGFLEHLY
jgi:hypothetical protein